MAYVVYMNWMIFILGATAVGAVALAIYERRAKRTLTFDAPEDVTRAAQSRETAIRGEANVAPPPNNFGGLF